MNQKYGKGSGDPYDVWIWINYFQYVIFTPMPGTSVLFISPPTHMHTHTHAYTHTCIHTHAYTHMHTHTHTHTHTLSHSSGFLHVMLGLSQHGFLREMKFLCRGSASS
jgi:hypothetical protein